MILALVLLPGAAPALELEGVKLPERVRLSDAGAELVLNGAGVRTRFFFRVYVGALYLEKKTKSAQAAISRSGAKRVALHILRELTSAQLSDALEDGLKNNHDAAELAKLDSRVKQLRTMFDAAKVVKPGDVILIDYLPDSGTRVTFNGDVKGAVAGEDFNRALLRVWLGESPADGDLKQGMLGG
ncbi:MAG: chalcone isomerase family protein [Burkholderiales bacterium]